MKTVNTVESVHNNDDSLTRILLTLLKDIPAHGQFADSLVEASLREAEGAVDGSEE